MPLQDPGATDETNCVPGTRHFGSEGRNSLHGPSFKEFNFSVFKDTSICERLKMTLRAEFFNLLNHPNFSNPFLPTFISRYRSTERRDRRLFEYFVFPDHRDRRRRHWQPVPRRRRTKRRAVRGLFKF